MKLSRVFRNMLTVAAFSGITFAASASDGQINFTGTILDSACTIDTNSANQTVNLGNVSKNAFDAAGTVAGATQFSIMLNNCPATVTSAAVKFDGTADSSDPDILALSSGQTAKGVGIAFYEEDGLTAIPLATQSKNITLKTSEGEEPVNSNKMTFVAKYKATQAAVVAGTANATSDFTIIYQ